MSMGGGSGSSSQQSQSNSTPLTADEIQTYFNQLDSNSGGRLGAFAQSGTAPVNYNGLSEGDLLAVGGAGETRRNAVNDGLISQMDQISNDGSLTYAQRQRSQQLANDSARGDIDAINKEVEASLAALKQAENQNSYNADVRNSQLEAQDLELLANIFFGGKGQTSSSTSSGNSSQSSFNLGII